MYEYIALHIWNLLSSVKNAYRYPVLLDQVVIVNFDPKVRHFQHLHHSFKMASLLRDIVTGIVHFPEGDLPLLFISNITLLAILC